MSAVKYEPVQAGGGGWGCAAGVFNFTLCDLDQAQELQGLLWLLSYLINY